MSSCDDCMIVIERLYPWPVGLGVTLMLCEVCVRKRRKEIKNEQT